jgi:multidrug efflux pump subunit AcrA (membrane-fusion protein)
MYKAKDLTEETEEIILKRQRNELENAQYFLRNTERFTKQMLEIFLPREERRLRESVRRLTIAHDKAKMTLPLALEQKKLDVARQRRDLEKSRQRLAKLESDARQMAVAAPTDGLVYYGRCVRGQWLQTAEIERMLAFGQVPVQSTLFTIVKPNLVHIRAAAEEKDFEALAVDQAASITPVALPKMKLNGKVATLGRIPLPTGGFDVVLRLGDDQPPEGLLPGYSVTARVKTYSKADALLLPASAIFTEEFDDEAKYVWLAGKEPKKQPVKLGQKMGEKVEILDGLSEGDEVLTEKPTEKKEK